MNKFLKREIKSKIQFSVNINSCVLLLFPVGSLGYYYEMSFYPKHFILCMQVELSRDYL